MNFFSSCKADEPTSNVIKMRDGNTIVFNHETIIFYENEYDFLHSVDFRFNCEYSFISNNYGPYVTDENYSITGYDDRFIGSWEKVIFGEWITKYGLEPNKLYYCATIKYVIYLPKLLFEEEYIPVLPLKYMGYTTWTLNNSFDIEFKSEYPRYVFYSGFRYIGYDENRQGIYFELPTINNKLIWTFSVKQ